MRARTPHEMAVQEAKKVARAALRLKYSILADREINEALPAIEAEINQALAEGREFRLNPAKFFQLEA